MNALLGWLLTFLFVNGTWTFFRAESFNGAISILKGMAGLNGGIGPGFIADFNATVTGLTSNLTSGILDTDILLLPFDIDKFAVVFGLLALIAPNSLQLAGYQPYKGHTLIARPAVFLISLSVIMLFSLFRLLSSHPSEFLYFNF